MDFDFLVKGIVIGFSVAAPVGPIGLLTIRKTLAEGRMAGLCTGLGAAFADTMYGIVAGFGLTAISSFILSQEVWLRILGGLFLVYLGFNSLRQLKVDNTLKSNGKGNLNNFVSTFFLTISNPGTIVSFLAIFAGLGLVGPETAYSSSMALVLGVFIGSASWWLILSYAINYFRDRFNMSSLKWINRISGLMIAGFGLYVLYTGIGLWL